VRKEGLNVPQSQTSVERLCVKARGLAVALDDVVWAVNSRHDTLQDFARHACNYAQSFFEHTSMRCRLGVDSEIPSLPFALPVRRNLFLALKEVLNNTAKHSGATELFLRISYHNAEMNVSAEDNGKGFDPILASAERNGLINIKQRIIEVGGKCEIISAPGKGCRVTLRVPVTQTDSLLFKWLKRRRNGDHALPESDRTEISTTAR
jgi:signal transduction histidine kinase